MVSGLHDRVGGRKPVRPFLFCVGAGHNVGKVFRKILQSTALADEGIMGVVRIIGKYLSYLFEIYLKKMSHFTLLNG